VKQPEGAISGPSNSKRKMDKIDQLRELFKAEHAKLEDEVSSVTNSLSKLGDEIITVRQDITKLSSTLHEELAELKNILLSMSETKNSPSPRHKGNVGQ
jgi:predicted  nucleic acid-binding Zn-ribbon protein